jgi:hypothetical protein
MTFDLGFNHLLTILQSPGMPVRTLPSSKKKKKLLYQDVLIPVR